MIDIANVCCKSCGHPLLQRDELGTSQQIKKVLSLPSTYLSTILYILSLIQSTYWVELSDMWVCGCCNSKFLQFPLEEIRARAGTCFVGDTFFLFHKDNLHEDSVELSGVSGKDSYGKVYSIA